MTFEPEDLEVRDQLHRAFPAPTTEEVDRAWGQVATARRGAGVWAAATTRFTIAAALVLAAFAAGYATGRSNRAVPAERRSIEQPSSSDQTLHITVRPPALLPASAIGGAP
jgi:hypothetical protein